VTWGLASLLLLGAVLAVGFAWYERTQPSSRLLAVVGTLAALAIIGRIAFAGIPNVKPSTDIVFIAGFALGAAPGFAVGAVMALASNFFFGQGPWTPWQMAAWGLVGIIGALVARTGVPRNRFVLAAICGLCGLLHGAILDASTWVVGSGGHTLAEYLTISTVSLPFNIAHAVGNVLFFLAFGPALIRAIERTRQRFTIRWQPATPVVVLVALMALPAAAPPDAQAASAAARAVTYLENARNADGGWGGSPGQASNGLHTAWAVYALVAAGRPADASDVLLKRLGTSKDIGDIERTILGLRASGADPRAAAGRDLVADLLAKQRRNGSIAGYSSYTSYGILALQASGERDGVRRAAAWLTSQANSDGGFSVYQRGGPSNADDTAGAIEALVAAGRGSTRTVQRAVAYLRRVQHRDGGWSLTASAPSNAQSTAFTVIGLTAAGLNAAKVRRNGRSGLSYLHRLQAPDGSVRYAKTSRQTPVWVTSQALLAFERAPLPIVPQDRVEARAAAAEPPGWGVGALAATLLVDPRH
jgi:energy-coupling factor transport system substrate-specific component